MKRHIYQLFVLGMGRVEIFFSACVMSAFIFYPNSFAGALSAFSIPLFFIRKRSGFVVSAAVIVLYLFALNALLVTGVKSAEGSKRILATTGGTLVTHQNLSPGDIVIGGFYKKRYSGEDTGRFSRGYNVAEEDGYSFSLPVIRSILEYRQELSDRLFFTSGSDLRLTQGIVLGDKKYLEDETKDKYFLTGLGHLLAISGLHVGLYAMVFLFVFSFLPFKLRLLPTGLLLLMIIPFTGFKVPVLRAGLIGFAAVTAKFFDYSADFRKLLLFFAGLFILVSPSMIVSPSFLLSFSAVYGLLHLRQIKTHRYLTPFMVGVVATVFIIPASAVSFGSFNISSIVSTPFLVPVLSMQVITFLIYLIFPSVSLEPLILLEEIHLKVIDIFADHLGFMFTLYKAEIFWALLMALFLFLAVRVRALLLTVVLLVIPYLPKNIDYGGYFPNMGAAKGFVVIDEKSHVFYKGSHGDFLYRFLPYLAELGIRKFDRGTVNIYGTDNIFLDIREPREDYSWVCVNSLDEKCKAIYHTRSDSYKCDDDRVHILYKNRCETDKTYLLSKTGDIRFEDKSK